MSSKGKKRKKMGVNGRGEISLRGRDDGTTNRKTGGKNSQRGSISG